MNNNHYYYLFIYENYCINRSPLADGFIGVVIFDVANPPWKKWPMNPSVICEVFTEHCL